MLFKKKKKSGGAVPKETEIPKNTISEPNDLVKKCIEMEKELYKFKQMTCTHEPIDKNGVKEVYGGSYSNYVIFSVGDYNYEKPEIFNKCKHCDADIVATGWKLAREIK